MAKFNVISAYEASAEGASKSEQKTPLAPWLQGDAASSYRPVLCCIFRFAEEDGEAE